MNSTKSKELHPYQWDLDALLKKQSYQTLEAKFLANLDQLVSLYEGNCFQSAQHLKAYLALDYANRLVGNRLFNYLSNNLNTNLADPHFNGLIQSLQFKMLPANEKLANFANELMKHKSSIRQWIKNDPELAKYHYFFEQDFRYQPHILSEENARYAAQFAPLSGALSKIFTTFIDQELQFPDVYDRNGKKHKLNNRADYQKYLKSSDRTLRENAMKAWVSTINHYRETFANLLYFNYLKYNISAKSKKHDNYVAATAFSDEIPVSFIEHIYDQVKLYAPHHEKFQAIRKRILKKKYQLDKVEMWDKAISVANNRETFTIEQAQELALSSLRVLGNEYVANLEKAFQQHWIDWLPKPGKRSGAYCIGGSKGLDKVYVMLNYNGKLDDVSTLVHELGHAMHAVEYNKHQDIYAENSIIFAEIPSTTNEILLAYYLLKKYRKQPLKQLAIYDQLITHFFASTTRQIIFSKFEWTANQLINEGQPFNADVAEQIYEHYNHVYTSTKAAPKNDTPLKKQSLTAILTIPHFYAGNYYVYKYAIGQVGALLTANKIFYGNQADLEQYYTFLRSGVSRNTLDTLGLLGFDLTTAQPWVQASEILHEWIEEYTRLAKLVYEL